MLVGDVAVERLLASIATLHKPCQCGHTLRAASRLAAQSSASAQRGR